MLPGALHLQISRVATRVARSAAQRSLDAAQLLDKAVGVAGNRLEPEVLVIGRGPLVDRIDDDEARRRLAIGGHRSAQGVPQQLRP